jgi:hypothetical protein
VVPPLVEVGCHQVQELFGPIQAPPQKVVLAGGAVEEGTEVVDGRALELLGREPPGPAVAGADPHDVDRAELADLAQLDDRQDQGVPDREAEEADQQQLLQLRPLAGDGHEPLPQSSREGLERPVQVGPEPVQQRVELVAVVVGELLGRDLPAYRFGELVLVEQPERLLADAGLDGIGGDDVPQLLELYV